MTQRDWEDGVAMLAVIEGLGVTISLILCVAKLTISPDFFWVWCLAPAWIPLAFVVSATLVMGAVYHASNSKEVEDGR